MNFVSEFISACASMVGFSEIKYTQEVEGDNFPGCVWGCLGLSLVFLFFLAFLFTKEITSQTNLQKSSCLQSKKQFGCRSIISLISHELGICVSI